MASTIPQTRIDPELDRQLDEISESYHMPKTAFVRTVIQIVVRSGMYRDWLGNKDGVEAIDHDRHYRAIINYLVSRNEGVREFSRILDVDISTAQKMWQRHNGGMRLKMVRMVPQEELEAGVEA